MSDSFDLLVLGAGSGGIAMAIRAARHGARVALVEARALGGTCVNVGCVPKKAMWLAAELAQAQRVAQAVGFALQPGALRWDEFIARRSAYIDNIHASYRQRCAELGIELVSGHGRFSAPHRLVVGGRALQAPHVLIATGAQARREAMAGGALGIDSDGFFALRACPRRVAIIGSGYIAVELGGVLNALGAQVTLVARSERLLRHFDHEITAELAQALQQHGITLAFSRRLSRVERAADGYALHMAQGPALDGFDELLWATGRVPNTRDCGLETTGITLDARGCIDIDAWQNTNVAGHYAVGDVTDRVELTPVAIAAARRLADRLFGGQATARMDYSNIPTVVFAHPPVATVGLTEQQARSTHGDAVRVYRTRFRPMLTALAGGTERTFMKLVCVGAEERIVGIHLLGVAADEILQGFAVALRMGARKADFDATVAIHPTSAEELVLM
ncbi:MAG: glutathione-disulfide reductase [Dokdonella sp.]|nr:MAG: glutathione-disulfide reductase [Dokdonella sp.]